MPNYPYNKQETFKTLLYGFQEMRLRESTYKKHKIPKTKPSNPKKYPAV